MAFKTVIYPAIVQVKYDQHQEKLLKIAQQMNGTRSVHVLIDGAAALSVEDSVKKTVLSEPLNDIQSAAAVAASTLIPAMKSQNGRESYYRFV